MAIRQATPEETQAFYNNKAVILSNQTITPESKDLVEQNQTEKTNLDQELHDKWLKEQSAGELQQLSKNMSALMRSKLEKK
jgi:hypothetical protein